MVKKIVSYQNFIPFSYLVGFALLIFINFGLGHNLISYLIEAEISDFNVYGERTLSNLLTMIYDLSLYACFLVFVAIAIIYRKLNKRMKFTLNEFSGMKYINSKYHLYLTIFIIQLMVVITGLIGLDIFPNGSPQHSTYHFDHMHKYYLKLFAEGKIFSSDFFDIFLRTPQGPQALIESAYFYIFGLGFIKSRFLVLVLSSINITILFLIAVSKSKNFLFSILVASLFFFSPWYLTFTRYTDIEHILSIHHYFLILYILFIAIDDKSKSNLWLLGAVLGLGIYIMLLTS